MQTPATTLPLVVVVVVVLAAVLMALEVAFAKIKRQTD